MGVAPDTVDCERFVRAWQRFRERFPDELLSAEHEDLLLQPIVRELPERQVSPEDFRDMLEATDTKDDSSLSTQEIRRRLGLLDRARASEQASTSESMIQEEHESIQTDMMTLAKQLKERTQTINQSLVEDVKILDAVGHSAESNTELLERENAVLKQQLASSIGFWTSLWLVMAAFMVFMATYIYIKLFSRRYW
ncbi:hypothetical protein ATCC90586_009408 [Pythium insidiosum]|nr:hypothetical protein ATCC90586_009408 [Pythium insidiosum]